MLAKYKKYQVYLLLLSCFFLTVQIPSANGQTRTLKVTVKCNAPEPGVYQLGWGTSRLHIPKKGKPYITFRTITKPVEGKICQSSDNIGIVVFEKNGEVWSYIRESE